MMIIYLYLKDDDYLFVYDDYRIVYGAIMMVIYLSIEP